MSSHDSKPQFSVDSFDDSDLDDISQLLDAFEQEHHQPDPHLEKWINGSPTEKEKEQEIRENPPELDDLDDDLLGLFDEPSPSPSYQPREQDKVTFSSLPSEEELVDLFGEFELKSSSSSYNPPKPVSASPEPAESDQDLLALFEDDDDESDDLENLFAEVSPPSPVDTSDEFDDLKSLLIDDLDDEVEVPSVLKTTSSPIAESLPDTPPIFYEVVEELAAFIEKSAHPEPIPDFAALEALINAPARPETVEETPEQPTPSASKDEDWDDMVKIASAMGHTIGPVTSPGTTAASPAKVNRPQKRTGFEETVRVSVKQLDNLSNLIGELVVKRNRLEQDQERLGQFLDNLLNHVQSLSDVGGRMQDLYERTLLEGALLASRSRERNIPNTSPNSSEDNATLTQPPDNNQDLDALEMDRFTGFHLLSQEMIELIVRVREASSDIQFLVDETEQVGRSLRQTTTQLQEGMTKTRMVPFGPSADRLVRPVREISRQLKKQARLNVEGKDVLIDKMILEHLSSPLTHLVNNAVTHGIESPDIRQQQGKRPEGQINVRSFLQGNQTVISFSDDGGGIDPEQIKRKAIEKNLVSKEEALALSNTEIYDFLFHPGFSTKEKADAYAGRGVGLDVVRTSLNDIRGSVNIDSEIGKGTTFTIRLPLTLSICKALCCLSNFARIAFPMDGVEDMKDYAVADLPVNDQGKRCIRWGQSLLPISPLSELLNYNRQLSRGNIYGGKPIDDTVSIVILRGAGSYLAIQVDQVVGEQEIVIKQIEGPAPKPPGIAGATVLGDGTIMPIGDVLELIEIAKGRIRTDGSGPWPSLQPSASKTLTSAADAKRQSEPTVLIVDDSLTVRQYLSHSFGKAGYRVEQARDGQEAWEKLRSGLPCDIVFCDIEMPRMNGLELLSSLQKDEHLSQIPIALLTSRGADRHRKVAAKLGASGYYIKPAPDAELLEAAERMMNGEVLLAGSVRQPRVIDQDDEGDNGQNTPSKSENPLVLIVDDSVMVREMLSQTFLGSGYRVEQARDGQDALEQLRNGLPCDLILCDIEMPKMNGLELLSRLQSDEGLSQIPVAMITSRGAQKMKKIAAERGAKGYFVKPYIEEVVLDSAKRLIAGEVLLEADSLSEV